MPDHTQGTTHVITKTEGGLGKAHHNNLEAMFPGSPLWSDYAPDAVRAAGNDALLVGAVTDGFCFSSFNRDYDGAPVIADVAPGDGTTLPNGWQPNPGSPGAGSMDPVAVPAPPDGYNSYTQNWGTGVGSETEPATSSGKIAQHTIGDYIAGKAPGPSS